MGPLSLLLLALCVPASAETEAERAARLSRQAALTADPAGARDRAGAPFTGAPVEGDDPDAVDGRDAGRRRRLRLSPSDANATRRVGPAPPEPLGRPRGSKVSMGLVLAGGAILGGLQGFLSAGPVGALAGAVLGLGAAWLYNKGHPAAAFGATAGGIIGSFLGGPIGGLIGAAVGGLVGWGLGKLFGI